MEKTVIKTGVTVDEAIEAALSELGCTKEQAVIEVIEEGSEGGEKHHHHHFHSNIFELA